MDLEYYKNFFGQKLSDDEMRKISHPYVELQTHVSLRFVQAGAIIGYFGRTIQYAGLRIFAKKGYSRQTMLLGQCKSSRNGMLIGLVLSFPILFWYKHNKNLDRDDIFDRAYRLRYNQAQMNIDRGALLGAAAYGAYFASKNLPIAYGIPKGIAWGVMLTAAWNQYDHKRKSDSYL